MPGSIPYVHVPDTRAAFEKALREGAEEMLPPERVMEGVTIAIVRAPAVRGYVYLRALGIAPPPFYERD